MTLQELKDLLREGETLDDILALEGKTAKELLKEKNTVAMPIVSLRKAINEGLSESQAASFLRTTREFALGNYEYMPAEKIPDYLLYDLRQSNQESNYNYLFCHILENLSEE